MCQMIHFVVQIRVRSTYIMGCHTIIILGGLGVGDISVHGQGDTVA